MFVSSTLGELAAERAAARAAIELLRLSPVMFEMGARDHAPEQVYRDYLEQSDIFVGIYWQSYGWIGPDRDLSGIEDELRLAEAKPRLIYMKEPAPERDDRLSALIRQIQQSGVATKGIAGPEDLADHLTQDIVALLSERFTILGRKLPTGTVTFLFADVEGSTQGLERHGQAFNGLLTRFRRESEAIIEQAGGTMVSIEGDGYLAVFTVPGAAIDAALAAQRAYLAYPDPGPLKVRMGIHSGAGVVVDEDYVGIDVHRAARVGAAANGGQILISAPARELLRSFQAVSLTDVGWYELKGIARPEHLHQVTASGLPTEFPAVRAQPSHRASSPRQLTSIVGREHDIDKVCRLLESGVRLLTLTGPGGIGKTRLAVAAVERVESAFRDGVNFVNLASVTDPARVAEAIVEGLGRSVEGAATPEDIIVDELRDRRFLLVVDNFEQVAASAPLLRRLLERLSELQVLVTSRVALQLSVEQEYPVSPLELPAAGAATTEVAESPAVRLLVERARAVRPDLAVDPVNATAIAELVRRLDGIPLAIELAAARLRLLEPTDVLRRLTSVLDLGAGSVDLPTRQRTLRSAIDWSIQLLTETERIVFARLGVFVDGWTLEAAEAVASGPEADDVATVLDTLAAHSLIRLETIPKTGVRMRLLGPLREYALGVLSQSGELDKVQASHAEFYARRVEMYPRGTGKGLDDWKRRTDLEMGNIRQAILWCVEAHDHHNLASFLSALWPLLWLEDRVGESREWLDSLRPHLGQVEPHLRALTTHVDGFFDLEVGQFESALEKGREALRMAEELGDDELAGQCQLVIAGALPAFDLDDPEISEAIEGAVAIFRRRGDIANLTYALNFLCSYQAAKGNIEAARNAIEEALILAPEIEALPVVAQSTAQLAFVDLISGDLSAAERSLHAALSSLQATPSREVLSYVLDGFGWLALAREQVIPGLTALGAAEGLRARVGLRPWPLTAAQIGLLAKVADSYQDPEAQAARRAGRELTPEAALAVVTES